jgi:hypothetical protein
MTPDLSLSLASCVGGSSKSEGLKAQICLCLESIVQGSFKAARDLDRQQSLEDRYTREISLDENDWQ